MSQKNVSVKKINIIVTVIFVVILAVSTALQISNNKKSAIMASDMVMNQVESVIDRNSQYGDDIEIKCRIQRP